MAQGLWAVCDAMPMAVVVVAAPGCIHANAAARELLGGDPTGQPLDTFMLRLAPASDGSSGPLEEAWPVERALAGHSVLRERVSLVRADASVTMVLVTASPLRLAGVDECVLLALSDVTEREGLEGLVRAQRERLLETRAEREFLLREVSHRVRNNLQLVVSLLSLQADQVGGGDVACLLAASRSRIEAMALAHERLVESGTRGRLDVRDYLIDLVRRLEGAEGWPGGAVEVQVGEEGLVLDMDHAIPFALMAHELIVNALHHSHPEGHQGQVRVMAASRGETLCFEVEDDGVGFPSGLTPEAASSLGLRLVSALANQLGGRVWLDGHPHGARASFDLRVTEGPKGIR